jgi:DNA-binding NarL/FixJ family response regulator
MNDAESVAFELEETAPPHVKPASIGYMAVRRVGIGRQFRQSIRSVTTRKMDKRCKRPTVRQVHVHLHDVAAVDAPPSEAVPGWMDYQEWLSRLNDRRRAIAEALSVGSTTTEVAREFGLSLGRISQMRREFMRDWDKFQHAN